MTDRLDLWIRRFHPAEDAATRLLCLPHAGGAASYYFPLSKALHPGVDVLVAQYPGRQDRRAEPCLDTVGAMADALADVLPPLLDRPLTLFGHSMGASVGYELALRLQERGTPVEALFASGRRAPSAVRDERAHLLPDDELIAETRRLSDTDGGLLDDPDIRAMVLPSLRADYRAAETYRGTADRALGAPVTALIGDVDPKVTRAEAELWAGHTAGGFDLVQFTGGHFYLTEHLPAIADRLAAHAGGLSPAG